MKLRSCLIGLALAASAAAAPLFPDPSEQHWARDAVAALAARGLVEGYPDGTFKGDRTASRWELALLVARLLARLEQGEISLASRNDLETVRQLADSLHEELNSLGARLQGLEQQAERLDRRVHELERIKFYGSLDVLVVAQNFRNQGAATNGGGAGVPLLDYQSGVTSTALATVRPQVHGVMPQVDYRNGRALTNGAGFTSRARLGMKLALSPDLEAGAEFAAFSSQGDRFVDGYWGLSAPWLLSPVTANLADGTQPLNNSPFTRMVLDRFWAEHKPSRTRLVVGSFDRLRMPGLVYAGQPNLGVNQPGRYPGYGWQLQGQVDALAYEVLHSTWGDGNNFQGSNYQHAILGANASYAWREGQAQAAWARLVELAPPGGLGQRTGLMTGNIAFGASAGYAPNQWVNPPGHFALQGVDRPISAWSPTADNAIGVDGGGNYGPQQMDTVGFNAFHSWGPIKLTAEYGHSQYTSNRFSTFLRKGDAWKLTLAGHWEDPAVEAELALLSVAPSYNPMNMPGNMLGVRFPVTANFAGRFFLHDNASYPHNRQGLELKTGWKFPATTGARDKSDQEAGRLWLNGAFLRQTRTSLYDVLSPTGSLGPAIPTNDVVGFAPGFFDPLFQGFAHPGVYGATSANSFTAALAPLENPRGSERRLAAGVSYQWERFGLRLQYDNNHWFRPSILTPAQGGSQNLVDLGLQAGQAEFSYKLDASWTAITGLDVLSFAGHLDPAGLYNPYALSTGSVDFTNLDSRQISPSLGLEHPSWSLKGRWIWTDDQLSPTLVAAGGATPHPFNWSGYQVWSEYRVKF